MKKTTDLSAYKKAKVSPAKPVLTQENLDRQDRVERIIGRPPKPKEELRTEKITLSFTAAEFEKIKEDAGLIPHATYLMAKLKEAGVIG